MSGLRGGRSTVAVAALIVLVALSWLFVGRKAQPSTIVMDDFESGAITAWQAVGSDSDGWFVYDDGHKAPDPAQSDPNVPLIRARCASGWTTFGSSASAETLVEFFTFRMPDGSRASGVHKAAGQRPR